MEPDADTDTKQPTLNKNGTPRKQLSPEALEKLKQAREKANAIRKEGALKKLEAKTSKMKKDLSKEPTEPEPVVPSLTPVPPASVPTEEPLEEEVEIVKEKVPKTKGKKKTKIIVEQSSDDSDEFEPNDNIVFVKRVSRKKKEPTVPPTAPPPDPPEPAPMYREPTRPVPTRQQREMAEAYDHMVSGRFLHNRRMY